MIGTKLAHYEVTDDPDRLERFRSDAQLLAQLNHPTIAGIHGVEDSAWQYALMMELAEGQTLAERLDTGPSPVEEALPIAKQIAEALEAAHERTFAVTMSRP